jgi:hypothetical protein
MVDARIDAALGSSGESGTLVPGDEAVDAGDSLAAEQARDEALDKGVD